MRGEWFDVSAIAHLPDDIYEMLPESELESL